MNTHESTAQRRTSCPRGNRANASHATPPTKRRLSPEVTRWVSSIAVSMVRGRCAISPWQVGQCWPQPAPEPVIRTTAPNKTTATV